MMYQPPRPDEKAQGFIRAMARELLVENPNINNYLEAESLAYETWARSQYLADPKYIHNLEQKLSNSHRENDYERTEHME